MAEHPKEEIKELADDEVDKGVDLAHVYCGKDKKLVPYVLQSPMRYIQGAETIHHFGRYLQAIGSKFCFV